MRRAMNYTRSTEQQEITKAGIKTWFKILITRQKPEKDRDLSTVVIKPSKVMQEGEIFTLAPSP